MAAVIVPVKASLVETSPEQNGFKLVYYFVLQIFGITIGGGAAMRETARRHQEVAARTQEELNRTKAQNEELLKTSCSQELQLVEKDQKIVGLKSAVIQSRILFALLAATIGAQMLGLISLRTESLLYAATMGSAVTFYGPRMLQFLASLRSGPSMDETRAFLHRIIRGCRRLAHPVLVRGRDFISAPISTTVALSHPDRQKTRT
jgi:hypothetical protein